MTDLSKVAARPFAVRVAGRNVPGLLWFRQGQAGRRPIVLVGHGGSQHKASEAVLDIVRGLVAQPSTDQAYCVAAIDGPVHGDRRADGGLDGAKVILEFRALWNEHPEVIDTMIADWRGAIDHLLTLPEVDPAAIGWFGLSMGTGYGMPLCAAEPRIRAALLGMWGTSHMHGERMKAAAARLQCPVRYHRKQDDERFTPEGQVELYDAIASPSKTFAVYPGRHVNPAQPELDDAFAFLRDQLEACRRR